MASANPNIDGYLEAFAPACQPESFIHYYSIVADKKLSASHYTRGEFWKLACTAAGMLTVRGLRRGHHQTHCFSANKLGDLVFRLAAAIIGTVPITINWQSDTPQRVVHKVTPEDYLSQP